jgi:hypothetical protein
MSVLLENVRKEIMSSNAFMLPALPHIPAPGLNSTDTIGTAALKSNRMGESSGRNESFTATLERISDIRYGRKPKAKPDEKPAATPRDSHTDSTSPQKLSETTEIPREHIEVGEAPVTKEMPPFIHPFQACNLMSFHLLNNATVDDGSWAAEAPSGSTTEPSLGMLLDLIGHLHPQLQPAEGQQVGIGPFEQLQANISPEAPNWSFFEQIAFKAINHSENVRSNGNQAQVYGSWHWMASPAAQEGAINGQPESSDVKGSTPGTPLLQILGIAGKAWGTNPNTGSSGGAEMAAAGHNGGSAFLTTGDLNMDSFPEMQARQVNENSSLQKFQASLKATAEQPADSNSALSGIIAKTPEEVFGLKSTALKSEVLPVHDPGNKIGLIDGDNKDSGFFSSQDQMPQHLEKLENAEQPADAAKRNTMSQTLNQIVQKAVLSFHNGQHEVQLHLKPEFLGNIRMQIVSEGQQIAIKIVADLPFVKDMLENNLHQLKTELQAQGLDIDELEVSVAHDSYAGSESYQKAESDELQAGKSNTDPDAVSSDEQHQASSRDSNPMAETAIDYFA